MRPWELSQDRSRSTSWTRVGSDIRVDARGKRGHARPAARERGDQRGVDLRQDAPARRRPAHCSGSTGLTCARTAGCARRPGPRPSRPSPRALKAPAPERIGAIAGDLAGVEEMFALKLLMAASARRNLDCRQDGSALSTGATAAAPTCSTRRSPGIDEADAILIVGANPRLRGADPQRRASASAGGMGRCRSALIGERGRPDLSPTSISAPGPRRWPSSSAGERAFAEALTRRKQPIVIVGQGALAAGRRRALLAVAAARRR